MNSSQSTTDLPNIEQPYVRRLWRSFISRVVSGLFLILPLLITCWVIRWLFGFLQSYVVTPITLFVNWKVKTWYGDEPLPYWFEAYAAPIIGIAVVLVLLVGISFFAYTKLHRFASWILVHIPVFSWIYNPVRRVFVTLESHGSGQSGHKRPQRMVLIDFPHSGMKVPAIVTATSQDTATGKTILCVYVPTTPVPTSGYFLLLPEEDATELNWDTEQTLQTIISGGLSAPPEVSFFGKGNGAQKYSPALPK